MLSYTEKNHSCTPGDAGEASGGSLCPPVFSGGYEKLWSRGEEREKKLDWPRHHRYRTVQCATLGTYPERLIFRGTFLSNKGRAVLV